MNNGKPQSRLNTAYKLRGARGVMVIIVENELGDTSSNPGRDCISHTLGKV